jgi:hypothetical protein
MLETFVGHYQCEHVAIYFKSGRSPQPALRTVVEGFPSFPAAVGIAALKAWLSGRATANASQLCVTRETLRLILRPASDGGARYHLGAAEHGAPRDDPMN